MGPNDQTPCSPSVTSVGSNISAGPEPGMASEEQADYDF